MALGIIMQRVWVVPCRITVMFSVDLSTIVVQFLGQRHNVLQHFCPQKKDGPWQQHLTSSITYRYGRIAIGDMSLGMVYSTDVTSPTGGYVGHKWRFVVKWDVQRDLRFENLRRRKEKERKEEGSLNKAWENRYTCTACKCWNGKSMSLFKSFI